MLARKVSRDYLESGYSEPQNDLPQQDRFDNRFASHRPGAVGPAADCPQLFTGISAVDLARITARAQVKEFARGQLLHIEGDTVKHVLLITSGLLKITKSGMTGTEVILRLGAPGDVIGLSGLVSNGKHCNSVQAFRRGQLMLWEADIFKSLLERFPVLHRNMVQILSDCLWELEARFFEVATGRVSPRVAFQLLRLVKQIGKPTAGGIEVSLSREELAQMTGTTMFGVSRLVSAWEALGIVKALREAVLVCDIDLLRTISES